MATFRRTVATLALGALLIAGAAGLSGGLELDDCQARVEGTAAESRMRWWPPGRDCVIREIATEGWVLYAADTTGVTGGGSVPAFLGVLLTGALIWLLVARARPHVPPALRLTAATTLAFAAFGAGSWLAGPFPAGLALGLLAGVPLAALADRRLRGGRGGLAGGAVAALAVTAVVAGFFFSLGLAGFGIALAAVALLAGAVARRRVPGASLRATET